MPLKSTTAVVTGGAGFIGSHLVDELIARNYRVVVLDNFSTGSPHNLVQHKGRPGFSLVEGDVRDLAFLQKNFGGADLVFHLATHCVRLSLTDPLTNHDINATGTLNTLVAAQRAKVARYVYCSSSEIYGNAQTMPEQATVALTETSPKIPSTVYGATKLVGEHYALAFQQTHGVPAMVLRPFNAYGPRAHYAGALGEIIPRFLIALRAGLIPVIFGDGTQTRDFTYVVDTAKGMAQAAELDALIGDSVNLARGCEVSLNELAQALLKATGSRATIMHGAERPGDIQRLGADTAKQRRMLPSLVFTDLAEGLKHYVEWMDRQNLNYAELASALPDRSWLEAA